jgi:hypothetical protein
MFEGNIRKDCGFLCTAVFKPKQPWCVAGTAVMGLKIKK